MFIAHGRKSDHQQQLLRDHLIESAELSQGFGKKLQLEHTCYLAGLLHDFGKYSDDFQHYLSAAYVFNGSINAQLAEKTGFTKEDAEKNPEISRAKSFEDYFIIKNE